MASGGRLSAPRARDRRRARRWAPRIWPGTGDPRDPNRCRIPLDSRLPNPGWPDDPEHPDPLEPTWRTRSIVDQRADPASVLSHNPRMIAVRNAYPAAQLGDLIPVSCDNRRSRRSRAGPGGKSAARDRQRDRSEADSGRGGGRRSQRGSLELGAFAGWHMRRLECDPNAYRGRAGVLRWDERHSWIDSGGEHPIGVGPHALEVLELIPPGMTP